MGKTEKLDPKKSSVRYVPTRIAVCKECGGKGVVYEAGRPCTCISCNGSGRVKVTCQVISAVSAFIPGKDDADGELTV